MCLRQNKAKINVKFIYTIINFVKLSNFKYNIRKIYKFSNLSIFKKLSIAKRIFVRLIIYVLK